VGPEGISKTWSDLPYSLPGALTAQTTACTARLCASATTLRSRDGQRTVIAEPGDWIVYWISTTHALSVHKPEELSRLFGLTKDAPVCAVEREAEGSSYNARIDP